MGFPARIKDAGCHSNAWDVMRVRFDVPEPSGNPEAFPVTLEAWDDFSCCITNKEIFIGTSENGNIPMISAAKARPGAPNWKPALPVPGGADINRLKGDTHFVTLSVGWHFEPYFYYVVRFDMCWEIPWDVTFPADLDCVLAIKYTYSSSPQPVLTWEYRDFDEDVYKPIVSGPGGANLKPTDAGASPGNLALHAPPEGGAVIDNAELWVEVA